MRSSQDTLIKLCAVKMAQCTLYENQLSVILLSNHTVSSIISALAAAVKEELTSHIMSTDLPLQMDKLTDMARLAMLLVLVRYQHMVSLEDDKILCQTPPTNITGEI